MDDEHLVKKMRR